MPGSRVRISQDLITKYSAVRIFRRISTERLLKVFDICLELPRDLEKWFGFAVDEISELVHAKTTVPRCRIYKNKK